MRVLRLRKCLLLCPAHSYIALKALLCVSPRSGSSCSPSLLLAGFSPFILAHVIWKKNFITCCTKKEGPGGVRQDAAVSRGRSFMFLLRDFSAAVRAPQPRFLMSGSERAPRSPAPPPALCEMGPYANSLSFYTHCSCSRAQGVAPSSAFLLCAGSSPASRQGATCRAPCPQVTFGQPRCALRCPKHGIPSQGGRRWFCSALHRCSPTSSPASSFGHLSGRRTSDSEGVSRGGEKGTKAGLMRNI